MPPTKILKDEFINDLIVGGIVTFTTKYALQWYKENKASRGRVDYSNLYTLILNPLTYEGKIRRESRGIWAVQDDALMEVLDGNLTKEVLLEDEDEFDKYLKDKIRGE